MRSPHPVTRLRGSLPAFLLALVFGPVGNAQAAKLVDVSILDEDYLIVHLSDGDVIHHEASAGEEVVRYTPELSTSAATQMANWTIKSSQDSNYGTAGQHPQDCYRKKKLSGHAQGDWDNGINDYTYEYTYEHWVYLRLPSSLQQGMTYTVEIASAVNSDTASRAITFDIYNSRSEAIHVNLVGYAPDAPHKAADLYHWMGNGGGRSYSSFEGNAVYIYNVSTAASQQVGTVSFWMASGGDVFGYNLLRTDVWSADFSSFTESGTYRLVVQGVGCSRDFTIASDVYADPFRVSVKGYYYMRIGEDPTGKTPPPRTPRYIPGVSPANTTVYLTTMHPYHPDWAGLTGRDNWDVPSAWVAYRKPGNPTNANAWGGHSDAADWDRHLGHVSISYDMLLPYLLTNGAISDDDTGIPESGNGVPDIIDEARNEVDFWLRLRDGAGYSHGLTNPNGSNELFQAGPTAIAAWANALNAAMLADAYRVAGQTTLMNQYRDSAITAYNYANALADPMLDQGQDLGAFTRGRDFKMMAAAFLYNVTGTQSWEDVVNAESVCAGGAATLRDGTRNQIWGTAAYLMTPRPVHYATLQSNMRTAIVAQAKSEEANLITSRPSRRATDRSDLGYFHMAQNVHRTIIAHAVATTQEDEDLFRKALALEADWGLGRNPINWIQMTTAYTALSSKRSVSEAYTSGVDDGVPGVHPGHTPYFNLDNWDSSMTMGRPADLFQDSYPTNVPSTWPIAEAAFPSRWVWAHTEFTPQQTMTGKMALYGYLYGLAAAEAPANPTLTVSKSGTGSGTVSSNPAGIDCGTDCKENYANGTSVALTASPGAGSTFSGWGGACSGTGTCTVTMSAARSVAAAFASTTAPTLTIYGDSLASGWDDWSWSGEINLSGTSPTPSVGAYAVNATLEGWGGFSPATESAVIETAGYESIKFWIHGGSSNKTISFYTQDVANGGSSSTSVSVTAVADTWTEITVPISDLGNPPTIARLNFFNNSASALSTFSLDEIRVAVGTASTTPSLSISDVSMLEDSGGTAAFTLTLGRSGAGLGTVTSSPSGITCGSDCSEAYPSGTSVTLTPHTAAGTTFGGWSGACMGAGACTVSMSEARNVTATFDGAGTVPGAVRYVGRVDASNPSSVRFAWQGAGFVATVSGSTVSVRLQTTGTPTVYFLPVIDGIAGSRFEVTQGAVRTITLATGLSAGEHVVELYRETEGMYGVSTFTGFAQGTVTGAPAASGRVLEVVGDSISAGYGNLGVEPHPGWVANPACHWTAESYGSDLASIKTHMTNVVAALNDPKIVTFDMGTQPMGSNGEIPTGCDWHPNVADHQRMAGIIRARLQAHLGW